MQCQTVQKREKQKESKVRQLCKSVLGFIDGTTDAGMLYSFKQSNLQSTFTFPGGRFKQVNKALNEGRLISSSTKHSSRVQRFNYLINRMQAHNAC